MVMACLVMSDRPKRARSRITLIALTCVQGLCAIFFVSDILLTIFGARSVPISWQTRELLEIGAAVGLSLGVVLGFVALRRSMRRSEVAEARLHNLQMDFQEHLISSFSQWRLTAAEQDVAMFSLKGMSVSEIAELRQTSEGTVKAQSNAIYRKAGVSGRTQLLSLFIEDLMLGAPHKDAQS